MGWLHARHEHQQHEVGLIMQIPRDAVLLRIFFGEDDRFRHLPLHEAIVLKAREMHLGGATVLRGHVGFGQSSRIHTTKILRLSQDLPVIVEIVDSQEKIDAFLPVLDGMMTSGLVTIEKVQVLQYGTGSIQSAINPSGTQSGP
jgi:PII-like signaling protein